MSKVEVRNNRNMVIGWLNDVGDCIQALHYTKGFIGRYVKSSNITFDLTGRIYCFGDGTQSLIRDKENELNAGR